LAAADPAHEREPEAADWSRAAKEVDPEFGPDRRDRMAWLAEYPAYLSNAANENPFANRNLHCVINPVL